MMAYKSTCIIDLPVGKFYTVLELPWSFRLVDHGPHWNEQLLPSARAVFVLYSIPFMTIAAFGKQLRQMLIHQCHVRHVCMFQHRKGGSNLTPS